MSTVDVLKDVLKDASRRPWLLAGWALGTVTGQVVQPVTTAVLGVSSTLGRIAQVILVVVIGAILIFVAGPSAPRRRAWWLLFAAVLLLITGLGTLARYIDLRSQWTIDYYGRGYVVTGDEYTEQARKLKEADPDLSDSDLLAKYSGDVVQVWTRESVVPREFNLVVLYLVTTVSLAAVLVTVGAAVHTLRRSPRKGPSRVS